MQIRGDYISVVGLRVDGRRPTEIRRLRSRLGLFSRADGSSYYEQGNTKVAVVIYGPRESVSRAEKSKAKINCDFSVAPFANAERKVFGKENRMRSEISVAIKELFEETVLLDLYPRTTINISIQLIQADGSVLAACTNAVTLALMDAGIALKDFLVACSVGSHNRTDLIDLCRLEEQSSSSELSIAIHAHSKKMILVQTEGKMPLESFSSLLDTAINGCNQIHEILQNEMRDNIKRLINHRDRRILTNE